MIRFIRHQVRNIHKCCGMQRLMFSGLSQSNNHLIDKISKEIEERDIRAKKVSDIYKRATIIGDIVDITNLRCFTDCNGIKRQLSHHEIIGSMYNTGKTDNEQKTHWRLVSSCGRNVITGKYENDATNPSEYEATPYDTPYDLVFRYAKDKFDREYRETGIRRIFLDDHYKSVNTIITIKEGFKKNDNDKEYIDIETSSTILRYATPSYYGYHDIHRLIETPNLMLDNAKIKRIIDTVDKYTNITFLRNLNNVAIGQYMNPNEMFSEMIDNCYILFDSHFVHKSIMKAIIEKIEPSYSGDMSIKYYDTEKTIRESINRIGAGEKNYEGLVKYMHHFDNDSKIDITEFMMRYSIEPHSLLCMIYNSNQRYEEYSCVKHISHDDAKKILKSLKNDIQFLYDRPIMIKFVSEAAYGKEKQIINKDFIDRFMYKGYIYECLAKLMIANSAK